MKGALRASRRSLLTLTPMELDQLAAALVSIGCPQEKSAEMAAQLDKRAKQLAAEQSRTYDDAMLHLLQLMRQGWAARDRGF